MKGKFPPFLHLTLIALAVVSLAPAARAQLDEQTHKPFAEETLTLEDGFKKGAWEGRISSGPMFSPIGNPANRPTLNYVVCSLQMGYMLNQPGKDGFFRGNFELIPEGFGAAIYEGGGNYIAGATLWLRYNFVQRRWRVSPYVQLGGGFVFTDTDREIVGQNFNFNLDVAGGLRYMFSSHWALSLEYRYTHISNANTGPKNVGINAQGPILGVSWFF
jgi:opacity protein-like surface antigen